MSACQLADIAQEKYSQAYLGMPEAMPMAPSAVCNSKLGQAARAGSWSWKEKSSSTYSDLITPRGVSRGSSASFNDAHIKECFVLFVYGILVAIVAFLVEHFILVIFFNIARYFW